MERSGSIIIRPWHTDTQAVPTYIHTEWPGTCRTDITQARHMVCTMCRVLWYMQARPRVINCDLPTLIISGGWFVSAAPCVLLKPFYYREICRLQNTQRIPCPVPEV